jgi:transcriptional regulator GlxA family with amidase domain
MSLAIGFVLFPNLTQLDFTGPLQVLHRLRGSKMHILAKTRDPVPSDCGLGLLPTGSFAEAPQLDLDGAQGLGNRQHPSARHHCSACTWAPIAAAR